MKFKLLKLLNIKKTVAVATSLCFLFTMVFAQGLSAAITPAPVPAINQKTFKSIEDYLLPFSVGRITDALYTGGDEIIINIQDLHSHAQAQRNISNILSILDKKYGLKNVYVEGGIGQVDTTWLTSIADEKLKETILNNMLESGRLTGGEYYSAETNKNKLLLGIEDKTTYINNLKRLNEIYSKKQEILKYISFLKYTLNEISKKYYSRDNLKLNRVISKHKEGKLSAEKYFTYLLETAQKANVNLRKYPSIVAFLQVLKKQDGLDTKKVNLAIAELLNDLKSQLPYDQYQALLAKVSDKNKETEFYFDLYKVAKEKGLLEKSDYRTLLLFFEYLSLNQNLNPVNLTLEENSLLQELNVKLSQNQNEKDIYFLQNYLEYFSGYLTNKLTADEYEYFINNMARFKLLWKKYVDINGIIELDSYLNLFNDFYKDNVERNRFFIKNIIGQMPNQPKEGIRIKANLEHAQKVLEQLSKTKKVKVVITGGFHTYGFTKLLQDKNISYIVITPNVKQQTVSADVLYENIFKEQVSALYNTLQKMLVSQIGENAVLNYDVLGSIDNINTINLLLANVGSNYKVTKIDQTDDNINLILVNDKSEVKTISIEKSALNQEVENEIPAEYKNEFKIFSDIADIYKQIRENKREGIANTEIASNLQNVERNIDNIEDENIRNQYKKHLNKIKEEISDQQSVDDYRMQQGTDEGKLTRQQIAQLKQDVKDINDFITNRNNLSVDKIKEIENKIKQAQEKISFGTAGHRGKMPADFNPYIAFVIAVGSAREIKENNKLKNKVFISYDTRYMGAQYARIMSLAFRALDIDVDITDVPTATPSISNWAKENSIYGMTFNITASHNPPLYNGIKPNNSDGSPALPMVTEKIQTNAQKQDLINYIEQNTGKLRKENVIELEKQDNLNTVQRNHIENVKQIFADSLGVTVKELGNSLEGLNIAVDFKNSALEPELVAMFKYLGINLAGSINSGRDVIFGGKVNPEPNEANTEELKNKVKELSKTQANVFGIATDPDGDRFNIYYVTKNGDVKFLSPDEAGMIVQKIFLENKYNKLNEYLKTNPSNKEISEFLQKNNYNIVTVRSADTTSQIDRLSEYYQNEMRKLVPGQLQNEIKVSIKITDIGFKNLAEAAKLTEKQGIVPLMLLESSGGLVSGLYDKDGLTATLLPLLLLKNANSTVENELSTIEENIDNSELLGRDAVVFEDKEGLTAEQQKQNFLDITNNFKNIYKNIPEMKNYDVETISPVTIENGVEIQFSNGNSLIIRASGTEPKIRIYTKVNSAPDNKAQLEKENNKLMALGNALVNNSGNGKYKGFTLENKVQNAFKDLFTDSEIREYAPVFFAKRHSGSMLLSPEINKYVADIIYKKENNYDKSSNMWHYNSPKNLNEKDLKIINYFLEQLPGLVVDYKGNREDILNDILVVLQKQLKDGIYETSISEKQTETKELTGNAQIVNELKAYSSKINNDKNRKLLNDQTRNEKLIREMSVGKNNKLQLDFSRTELDEETLELCNNLYDNLGISEKLSNIDMYEDVKRLFFAMYVYYHKVKGIDILSVLPYDNNSAYIVKNAEEKLSDYVTVLGQPGTNGQHSFYQLLHQGVVPSFNAFVGFANSTDDIMADSDKRTAHFKLLSNMIAQADAFFIGRNRQETNAIEKDKDLQPHKVFEGNTPSLVMMFKNNDENAKKELSKIETAIAEIAKAVETEPVLKIETDKSVKVEYKGFTQTAKFKEIQNEKSASDKETVNQKNSKLTLKSNIKNSLINKYVELFKERKLFDNLKNIFNGVKVNATEGRAVLHSALRNVEFVDGNFVAKSAIEVDGKNVMPNVENTLNKMTDFANRVINGQWKGATGKEIKTVVSIGIGGSDLGPRGVTNILAESKLNNAPEVRYVSNVDPQDLENQLKGLDPETTLFIIESKTFTTDETMTNANAAKKWLLSNSKLNEDSVKNHFVAVSTAKEEVEKFGIDTNNMFEFWDWVGGRFSVWSAIGLPVMLSIGPKNFADFLKGANNTDEALKEVINGSVDADNNVSVLAAISYIDRINHLGKQEQFINAPFDFFVDFIQQQSMESLGKFVTVDGKTVAYPTGNVIVPAENSKLGGINVAVGETSNNKYSSDDVTTYIDMDELSPESLGELFATFEHVVEISAALWEINAFDQWGVQLGKELMPGVLSAIEGEQTEQAKNKLNLSSQKNVEFINNVNANETSKTSFIDEIKNIPANVISKIKSAVNKILIALDFIQTKTPITIKKELPAEYYDDYNSHFEFNEDKPIYFRTQKAKNDILKTEDFEKNIIDSIKKMISDETNPPLLLTPSHANKLHRIYGLGVTSSIEDVKKDVALIEMAKIIISWRGLRGISDIGRVNDDLRKIIEKDEELKKEFPVSDYSLINARFTLNSDGNPVNKNIYDEGNIIKDEAQLALKEVQNQLDEIKLQLQVLDRTSKRSKSVPGAGINEDEIEEQIQELNQKKDELEAKIKELKNANTQLDLGFGKWAPVIESPMLFISLFVPAFRKNFIEMHNYSYENNIKGAYKDFFTIKTTNGTERDKRADIREIGYGVNFVSIFTFAFSLFVTTLVGIVLGNGALYNLINYVLLFTGLSYPLSIAFHQIWNSFMDFLGTPESKLNLGGNEVSQKLDLSEKEKETDGIYNELKNYNDNVYKLIQIINEEDNSKNKTLGEINYDERLFKISLYKMFSSNNALNAMLETGDIKENQEAVATRVNEIQRYADYLKWFIEKRNVSENLFKENSSKVKILFNINSLLKETKQLKTVSVKEYETKNIDEEHELEEIIDADNLRFYNININHLINIVDGENNNIPVYEMTYDERVFKLNVARLKSFNKNIKEMLDSLDRGEEVNIEDLKYLAKRINREVESIKFSLEKRNITDNLLKNGNFSKTKILFNIKMLSLSPVEIVKNEDVSLDLGLFSNIFAEKRTLRAIFAGVIESLILVPVTVVDTIQKILTGNFNNAEYVGKAGQWFLNAHGNRYKNNLNKKAMEIGLNRVEKTTAIFTVAAAVATVFVAISLFLGSGDVAAHNLVNGLGIPSTISLTDIFKYIVFALFGSNIVSHSVWNIFNPGAKLDLSLWDRIAKALENMWRNHAFDFGHFAGGKEVADAIRNQLESDDYSIKIKTTFNNIEKYIENIEKDTNAERKGLDDLKKLISIKSNILDMYAATETTNFFKQIYDLTENNKTENDNVLFNYEWTTVILSGEYEQIIDNLNNLNLPEIKDDVDTLYNSLANVEESGFMAISRAIELYNKATKDTDRKIVLDALKNMQEAIENRIKDIEEGKQKVDDKKLEALEQYLAEIKNITESETDVRFTKDSTKENSLVNSLDNYINDETNNRVLRFGVRIAREFVVGILEVFDTFTIMFNPEKFLLEHNDYRMAVYKSAINTLYVQSKKYQEDLKDKNNDYERLTTLITLIPESEKETLKELKLLKNLLDTSNEKNFRKEFDIDEVQKAKETKDKMEKGARVVGIISVIALIMGAVLTFNFAGLDVGALSNLVNLLLSMLAGTAGSLGANAVVHAFWNIFNPNAKLTKDMSIDSRIISKVEDINKVNNEIDDQIDAKIKNLKEQKVKYEAQKASTETAGFDSVDMLNASIRHLQEIKNSPFETKLARIAKYNDLNDNRKIIMTVYTTNDKGEFDNEIGETDNSGSGFKPITINGQTVTDDMVNKIKEEIILLNTRKEKKPELPFTEKTLKVEGWTLRNVIGNIYKNDSFKTVEVDNALGELIKIEDIDYRNTGFKNYEDMCKKLTKLITNLPSEKNKINPIIKQIVEDNLINTKLAKQDLLQNLYSIYETEIIKLAKQAELLGQKRTLTDIYPEDLQGKTIGLVLDLNVPVMNGKITDYTRIDATLETIKYLTDRGVKVVAMSHHGRPKGWETEESLEIVAKGIEERAKEVLNYDLKVKFPKVSLKEQKYSNYLNSDVMKNTVEGMNNGNVLLLENLRFDDRYSGDNKADMAEQFVDKLGLDGVVFDAFGVSHRNNFIRDMIEKVNGKEIGALTGFLVEKELNEFAKVETPKHPFVAILGGSKVSDKIGVIENLLDKMTAGDTIVIGGAMAYTFLKAQNIEIGKSLVEDDKLDLAIKLQKAAEEKGVNLLLPVDHIVTSGLDFGDVNNNKADKTKDIKIPKDKMGADIGPKTVEKIESVLEKVGKSNGTIVWNGPSGVFEIPVFAEGTTNVAKAVAQATDNGAFSMIGGGDSVSAANKAGVAERISHISTGGGASLNLLEGKSSPLIEVIPSKFQREVDEVNKRITKKEELLNGKVTNKGKIVYQKTKGERNMMKLLSRFIERGEFETSGESQTLLGRILHADGRKATEEELYISRTIRFIKQSSIEEMLAGFDNDNLAENIKTVDGFINDFKKNSVNFKPETSFERNYINTLSFDYFVEKWNEYKNTKAKNYSTDEIVSIDLNSSSEDKIKEFVYGTALKLQQDNNWSDEGRKIFENYMFARIAQIKGISSDEILDFDSFTPTAWQKEGVNFDGVITNLDNLKDEKYIKEAKSVDVGVYLMNGGIGSSIEREDYLVSINWYKEQIEKINNPKTTQQEKTKIEEQINKVFNNEINIKDVLGNKYENYKSKVELAAKADDLYFRYKDENDNTRLISITELKNNSYSQQIENGEFKTLKETVLVSPDSLKPVKASIAGNPIMQKTLGLSTLMQEKYPVSRYNEETGNFEILVGKNYPTAPGGHGVWFATIWSEIIKNNYDNGHISFVGNSDALAARPDQSVVGYMEKENVGIVMLAAEREASDAKGGIFGLFKNRLTLGEIAQFEAVGQEDVFEDVGLVEGDDAQAFNTNSIYTNDKLLKDLYEQLKKIGITDADIEQMMQPDLIVNGKEKEGIGKYDQLEGALGASVLNFNLNLEKLRKENKDLDDWMNAHLGKNQPLVQVVMASKQDREEVFTPIKKAFDFWKQATNWVVVNGNNWLTKSPKGHGTVNVSVKNSKGQAKQNYKDVSYFMDNWTNDDISELDKLSVNGYNVKLQNLKLEGEVIIENETGEDFVISKVEDLASENISIEAISNKYGIKNVTLKDFEYDRNSNSLRRTGEEKTYLVLKDVKIIKKADGSVTIESLNKGYTETVGAAKEQTTEIIKGANEWLQIQSLNIISLFKEKTEIVAIVDMSGENAKKEIAEAEQLAQQGIKVKLVKVGESNAKRETGEIASDTNGNLSFELMEDESSDNLKIYSYESVDGQTVNVVDNVLEKMGNINKAKKILYVSSELIEQGQNRTALNSAVIDNTILTYSKSSISEAVAQGIVAYKNKDKALNTVVSYNSMIASFDVNDNVTEADIANLKEQGIENVMIKTTDAKAAESLKDEIIGYGISDVIIVVDNNGTYNVENEDSKVVSYDKYDKAKNIEDVEGVIVYIGSQEQDNLILTVDDMRKLMEKGAVLAFDADILNYMDSENTKENGITLLGIIKSIFTQSSLEAKRNRAIEKGRNIVIEKGTVSKEDIEKLKSEVKSDEEKEGIELGVLQASELQKIDADLLKDLNDRADIANELLTMLGEYRKLAGKSFKMGDGESKINGKENINTVLNNLRQEYKSATTDEAKVAAISGIIQILLTDRLASINDIENLTDNMDIKSISALLSAA